MSLRIRTLAACLASMAAASQPLAASAQQLIPQADPPPAAPADPTYADLVSLADSASLVVQAQIRRTAPVEQARGSAPGYGRFYVEALTQALLTGSSPIGESVRYLVDLPVDAKGRAPKLKKHSVFLFARTVEGRPGELQLVNPRAQLAWTPERDARVRSVLKDVLARDAPAKVTGVRELLYVPGNLAGQGETQIFLKTGDSSAASITVRHEPGAPVRWGVSFSELTADIGNPPSKDSLEWYRLACALPQDTPPAANVSGSEGDKAQAAADYRTVLAALGPCERHLT